MPQETELRPGVEWLIERGVRLREVGALLVSEPRLLGLPLTALDASAAFLVDEVGLPESGLPAVIRENPRWVGQPVAEIRPSVEWLSAALARLAAEGHDFGEGGCALGPWVGRHPVLLSVGSHDARALAAIEESMRSGGLD